MPTFAYMRRIALASALLLSSFAFACGEPSGDANPDQAETGDDAEVNAGATLELYVRVAESKIVFSSQTKSFGVKGSAR